MTFNPQKLLNHLTESPADEVASFLKKRLNFSGMDGDFDYSTDYFSGDVINFTEKECLSLKFRAPKDKYPHIYKHDYYSLLFSTKIINPEIVNQDFFAELRELQSQTNYDCIAFISIKRMKSKTIAALKDLNCYVIQVIGSEFRGMESFEHYQMMPRLSSENALLRNLYINYLERRLKKLFHMILSEIAAPLYDKEYGRDNLATQATMRFEETLLKNLCEKIKTERGGSGLTIVDVGCGSGRHSFLVRNYASSISAFDISSRMIIEAKEKKKEIRDRKLRFSVADFEYETIVDEHSYTGSVDLIIASFGMGSFIENTDRMIQRFFRWLRPGGYLFISFYNEESILNKYEPPWRDTSLSANIDAQSKTLHVTLPTGQAFQIFCNPFTSPVQKILSNYLQVEELHSFPTMMSILPNSVLSEQTIHDIVHSNDIEISKSDGRPIGHYISAIARRGQEQRTSDKILETIKDAKYSCETLIHANTYTLEDVVEELSVHAGDMVKAVLLQNNDKNGPQKFKYVIAIVSGLDMVDTNAVAELVDLRQNKLRLSSTEGVLDVGFPIGGLSPFPLEINDLTYVVDKDLFAQINGDLYLCGGDADVTLKMERADFLGALENYPRGKIAVTGSKTDL